MNKNGPLWARWYANLSFRMPAPPIPISNIPSQNARSAHGRAACAATPVLILGGLANTLSITRSLGRNGIRVSVSSRAQCLAFQSRYCKGRYPVPPGQDQKAFWQQLLLSGSDTRLHGYVILACNDEAIEFIVENRAALERHYLLEKNRPDLQLALLDKQKTLELARAAGIPTPGFWKVETCADIAQLQDEVEFPVIIKPLHSHLFQRAFGGAKYFTAGSKPELQEKVARVLSHGLRAMVMEMIPGPDSLLSSYYTYHDEAGDPLFHFTKRVFRRFPVNEGGASYHISEWLPETAAMGKRFFQSIGLRGLGNIEFKRDLRDGKLKVIECNMRFTAAQELLVRCGLDIAQMTYDHLTGRTPARPGSYKERVRLLFLFQDIAAFRQLKGRGELGLLEWLGSLAHPQNLPTFSCSDPWPAMVDIWRRVRARSNS